MATGRKRRDYSVLEFVGGALAIIVGLTIILGTDSASAVGWVGLVLVPVGIVLLILAFVQYGRNVRAVSKVVMGAAVKLNTQPAPASSVADEIGRLTAMHESGSLSDAEFAAAKAKALSN